MEHSSCTCQRIVRREERREERGKWEESSAGSRRDNVMKQAWKRMSGSGSRRAPGGEDEEAALPRRDERKAPFDNGEVNRPTHQRNFVETEGEEEIPVYDIPSIPMCHMGSDTANQGHGQSAQERIDGAMISVEQGYHRKWVAKNINVSTTPSGLIKTETVTYRRLNSALRRSVQQRGSGRFTYRCNLHFGGSRGNGGKRRRITHSSGAHRDNALCKQTVYDALRKAPSDTEQESDPQLYMPGQEVGKEEPLPKKSQFSQSSDLTRSQHEFSEDQSDTIPAKEDTTWNKDHLNIPPLVVNRVVVNSDVSSLALGTLTGILEEDCRIINPDSCPDETATPQSASRIDSKRPEVPLRKASLSKKSHPQIATPRATQEHGARKSLAGMKRRTRWTKSKNTATPSAAMTTVVNKKPSAPRVHLRTKLNHCLPHKESTLTRLSRILLKQESRKLYAELKKNPRSPCYLEPKDGHVYHPGTRQDTQMWIYEQFFDHVRKRQRSVDSRAWNKTRQVIQSKKPAGEVLRKDGEKIDAWALENSSTENTSARSEDDSSASCRSDTYFESKAPADHLVSAGLDLRKHTGEAINESHIFSAADPRNSKQPCSAAQRDNKPRRRRPQQKRKSDERNTTKATAGSGTGGPNNENPGVDGKKPFSAYRRKLTEPEEDDYEMLHGGGTSALLNTSTLGHDSGGRERCLNSGLQFQSKSNSSGGLVMAGETHEGVSGHATNFSTTSQISPEKGRPAVHRMRDISQNHSSSRSFMAAKTSLPGSIHSTTPTMTRNATAFLDNPDLHMQGVGERSSMNETSPEVDFVFPTKDFETSDTESLLDPDFPAVEFNNAKVQSRSTSVAPSISSPVDNDSNPSPIRSIRSLEPRNPEQEEQNNAGTATSMTNQEPTDAEKFIVWGHHAQHGFDKKKEASKNEKSRELQQQEMETMVKKRKSAYGEESVASKRGKFEGRSVGSGGVRGDGRYCLVLL